MFFFEVELRNKRGEMIDMLDLDCPDISWTYSAVGGCGVCPIRLDRESDNYGDLDLDYDVRIHRTADTIYGPVPAGALLPAQLPIAMGGPTFSGRQLYWSGFVSEINPIFGDPEEVRLVVSGYSRQLEYVFVPKKQYQNLDVGEIARQVIDEFVLPGTQIKRTDDFHLCQDTGVIAQDLNFDASAFEVLSALAAIGGNAEWGVRADREIYFMPRSSDVKHNFVQGDNVRYHSSAKTTEEVVQRVHIRGGDGVDFLATSSDFEAGRHKERPLFAPYVVTPEDAALLGTALFAKSSKPQAKGRIVLGAVDGSLELRGHPLGRLRVLGDAVFMRKGAALPATIPLDLGAMIGGKTDIQYRISAIKYQPTDEGLDVDVELGERGSPAADLIRGIQHMLSDLRQGVQ